jgi:hypothetical protein
MKRVLLLGAHCGLADSPMNREGKKVMRWIAKCLNQRKYL